MSNINSAHIILDKYVAKHEPQRECQLCLPSNLTLSDKEQILINYLQSDNSNVNYVRLISQIRDNDDKIRISPKTRLLAERLEKKLNEEMLSDPNTVTNHWSIGVQFVDKENIDAVCLAINEEGIPTYTYSIPYIRECNNFGRVANCISLFRWLNAHFLINLINKKTEVDALESSLIDKGIDSYSSFMIFINKVIIKIYNLINK